MSRNVKQKFVSVDKKMLTVLERSYDENFVRILQI